MALEREKKAWSEKYVPISFKVIIVSIFILALLVGLLGFFVLSISPQYLVMRCDDLSAINWMPIVDRYCRELTSNGFPVKAIKSSIFIGYGNLIAAFLYLIWLVLVYKNLGRGERCLYQEIKKNGQEKMLKKISIVLILSVLFLLGYGLDLDFEGKIGRYYASLHLGYTYFILHTFFLIICYYLMIAISFVFLDYFFMRQRRRLGVNST